MVYRVLLVVFFLFSLKWWFVPNWWLRLPGFQLGFRIAYRENDWISSSSFSCLFFFFCLFFSVFYGVWASVSVAVAWWWRRSTSVPRCSSIILTLIPLSFSAFYASGNNSDGLSWVKYKNSMLPWEFEKKKHLKSKPTLFFCSSIQVKA